MASSIITTLVTLLVIHGSIHCVASEHKHLLRASVSTPSEFSLKEQTGKFMDPVRPKRAGASILNLESYALKTESWRDDQPTGAAGKSSQMSFRPVSVTLYIVMTLTILCVVVYTTLAFFRNRDEFESANKASLATDVLQAASRSAGYCPVVCMTCVACRMYILAATQGMGEPPTWIKACMITAASGCVLQFFVVLFLGTAARVPGNQTFSDATGGLLDQHPQVGALEFGAPASSIDATDQADATNSTDELDTAQSTVVTDVDKPSVSEKPQGFKKCAWISQLLCVIAIHGGVTGIVVGTIILSVGGTNPVSPSVGCTLALAALFFFIVLGNWATKAFSEHGADATKYQSLQQAFSSASCVSRKAPMIAVLFLVARMRAINHNPPNGMPPLWAQVVFVVTTVALAMEILGAMIVGYTGRESSGYYGEKSYSSSRKLALFQHGFAILSAIGVMLTFVAINLQESKQTGQPAPIAPAVKCVLNLNFIYFLVMTLQTAVVFRKDVLQQDMPMLQDILNSACIALGITPLLCILFIATRMRALQITQQMGSPPAWAQDAMFICTFATTLQVVCCLALPMFTGMSRVDGDGNPMFDMKPLIGAYVVTLIKFIALLCLHGGIIAICIAVLIMTPETAKPGVGAFADSRAVLRTIFVALLVVMISLLLSSAKVIGLGVKFAIESIDRSLLGVDIHVKAVSLGLFRGLVMVHGLKIDNPEGYESPCLLEMKSLVLKVNIGRIIASRGKEIEVTWLELTGVHINYEKDFYEDSSTDNVQQLIQNLEANTGLDIDGSDTPVAAPNAPDREPEPSTSAPSKADVAEQEADAIPDIIVHRIKIDDISANIYNKSTLKVSLEAPTIDKEDFYEYCGGAGAGKAKKGVTVIMAVLLLVLKTVLLSATAVYELGKLATSVMATKAARKVMTHVTSALKGNCGNCFAGCGLLRPPSKKQRSVSIAADTPESKDAEIEKRKEEDKKDELEQDKDRKEEKEEEEKKKKEEEKKEENLDKQEEDKDGNAKA